MKAKDTVMRSKQLDEIADSSGDECLDFVCNAINAQAEISFKAGIKEVVEWFEHYYDGLHNQYSGLNRYLIPRKEREAKLKEWEVV